MSAKTLLMLGAGAMQVPAIEAARRLGVRVVAVDPRDHAPGLALADAAYLADLADMDHCLQIAREVRPDGITTFAADFPVRTVAHLTDVLDLPGITLDAAWNATDKNLMRRTLAAAGVPCPAWITVRTLGDALDALEHLSGPAIVKPALSAGSRGVTQLDPDASDATFNLAYERAHAFEGGRGVLIEEYVQGPEFSVEAVTWGGHTEILAVTDKVTTGPPYFVETAHSQPTHLTGDDLEAVHRVTRDTVAALGLDGCASHTELRLVPGRGPMIMEAAARAGGGYIASHLTPLSTGIDMAAAVVSIALGEQPDLTAGRRQGSAIVFLIPRTGRVELVEGVEAARSLPGVRVVEVGVHRGDIVPPLVDTNGRVGHVICTAATAAGAMARCRTAAEAIKIET